MNNTVLELRDNTTLYDRFNEEMINDIYNIMVNGRKPYVTYFADIKTWGVEERR